MTTLEIALSIDPKLYGFQVLVGFGTGMTMSSISLMTSLQVLFKDHAVAQGLVAQARVL